MAWFSEEFNNLNDLFLQQLKDIYDAENRIVDALPKMAKTACNAELQTALDQHLDETRNHVARLEQVFAMLGKSPERETCNGIKGLLREGENIMGAKGDDSVRDAGLIAAAQRVEHYEIAVYGTLRTLAQHLGLSTVASLLQQTLDEEGAADKKLTAIAETSVNLHAAQPA